MKANEMTELQKNLWEFYFIRRPTQVSPPIWRTYSWNPRNGAAMVVDDRGFPWVGRWELNNSYLKPPRELRQLG